MTELYPSDIEINALSGTSDAEQEVYYPPIGESPYYTSFYKMLQRLLDVARRAGDLRVYKDGDLTFGVRTGQVAVGDTITTCSAAAGQALTDDATNSIYLTAAGAITVSTSGFPAPLTTPHVPLATIATGSASAAGISGSYAAEDITDCRSAAIMRVLGAGYVDDEAVTAAKLADGAVTGAKLSTSLGDSIASVAISAGSEGDVQADRVDVTLQLKDAAGNDLAVTGLIRVWISQSDFGVPSATGNTVSLLAGGALAIHTAEADYDVLTASTGQAEVGITISGAATRYLMAEINGIIVSSGALTWT